MALNASRSSGASAVIALSSATEDTASASTAPVGRSGKSSGSVGTGRLRALRKVSRQTLRVSRNSHLPLGVPLAFLDAALRPAPGAGLPGQNGQRPAAARAYHQLARRPRVHDELCGNDRDHRGSLCRRRRPRPLLLPALRLAGHVPHRLRPAVRCLLRPPAEDGCAAAWCRAETGGGRNRLRWCLRQDDLAAKHRGRHRGRKYGWTRRLHLPVHPRPLCGHGRFPEPLDLSAGIPTPVDAPVGSPNTVPVRLSKAWSSASRARPQASFGGPFKLCTRSLFTLTFKMDRSSGANHLWVLVLGFFRIQ